MDCSAKREVEEGMEEGVHESERMHESKGLVHESESEPNLAGNSSGFNISDVYKDETEAYECFCTYAHDNGFSVRKDHHSFWQNSKKIKSKDFVCSKAGFKKSDDHTSGKRKRFTRPVVRTGCPAMVRFVTDEDGYWHIKRFIESHNHELASPADRHLLRSCRNIIEENASVLKSMTDAGIRTVDAYAYLAEEVGGYRQVEDHMFAWDVQYDDEDRLLNFFWVDGRSRIDYECFGDVLIFDTSYRLNKYNFVCAPFVGVNNHWQNILFGLAFLSEETIESFTWLFKTFVRIMGNKYPTTIFTNQDQAMARAIEVALPHTRHRLCQWHIFKKVPSKVSIYNSNNKVRGLFHKCMRWCDSEEVFEEAWDEMIKEENLHNHEWLQDLYKIRRKWSTAFNKDSFCMGILSTQRSECTNNVYHGISKPTSSLTDCFLGLEKLDMAKFPEKYLLLRWSARARQVFYSDKKSLAGDNTMDEPSSTQPTSTQMNFSSMPECFSEEYITGRPSSQPGAEYTKLMMDFLSSELEFNEFAM
ncbi:hypothetical protein KFK09_019531 [Dendrobium nobile]|uniref:Protein FAR1-RELATED SEQUENCE n=1 Tax=Dendrobium nobile TaxID=94219 RepID=A0A8T3ARB5_DENNO|nr:hypothetical protein KFK09_019531 [Dendrobium nobile]